MTSSIDGLAASGRSSHASAVVERTCALRPQRPRSGTWTKASRLRHAYASAPRPTRRRTAPRTGRLDRRSSSWRARVARFRARRLNTSVLTR
jgi:hypothetical protein